MNVPALNYLLRSEIYVTEDGQLRAAHLVLGYQPLSSSFQAIGHAIRAGSPRLARIDVSKDGFLAQRDLPPVVLPGVRNPYLAEQLPPINEPGAAVLVEEEAESSRLSLEEEIDEFYFEEEVQQNPLVELSDPEAEQDQHSAVGVPSIVICSDDTSDEEAEPMAGKGKTLKELMASRGKGQSSKGQSSKGPTPSQVKTLPPVVPQGVSDPGLKVNPDLKKKRPVDTPEEGEVIVQPTKQQKPLGCQGAEGVTPRRAGMRRTLLRCALPRVHETPSWSWMGLPSPTMLRSESITEAGQGTWRMP